MKQIPNTAEQMRKEQLLNFLAEHNVPLDLFPYEWLCSTDFFSSPASNGFHLSVPGGLYTHSMNVAVMLLEMESVTSPWSRPESPIIIGLLHDVTKIGKYTAQQDMNPKSLEFEPVYIKNAGYENHGGHGADSVMKLSSHIQLTEEEMLCIRYHMGAYDKADWDGYDKAIRKYPNVLWTHTADMYASKLLEA